MKDQFQEAASMLNHAAMENRRTMSVILHRYNHDPLQIARGVAKYHLGIVAYAQMLDRLCGREYGQDVTEEQKQCAAHIMSDIRRWHVANFGIEPPWIQAIQQAQQETQP